MKTCTKCQHTKSLSEFYRNGTRSNPDRRRSTCRLCHQPITKAWGESNRDRVVISERARYMDKVASDPLYFRLKRGVARAKADGASVESFSSADLLAHWDSVGIDATRCHYTGEPLGDDWELDHMTPLSRGGSHSVGNLVPCSRATNRSKGNRTVDEYREAVAA